MKTASTNMLFILESPRVIRSVKAVLRRDGYLVQINRKAGLNLNGQENKIPRLDALEIIRTVRKNFPSMSHIVLIPAKPC